MRLIYIQRQISFLMNSRIKLKEERILCFIINSFNILSCFVHLNVDTFQVKKCHCAIVPLKFAINLALRHIRPSSHNSLLYKIFEL